eukprot:TRINITY_DN12704_c0_g1_i1.p1 TRINITY_DN12704_c0_g1~~TRINITY_DN12704_c0_g1_i1.p1  ORF type:complete len:757 (+),score=187.42 TRINITY_DN12704_c0_g1_i1:31-2271(+)
MHQEKQHNEKLPYQKVNSKPDVLRRFLNVKSTIEIDENVGEAFYDVRSDQTDTNYAIFGYHPTNREKIVTQTKGPGPWKDFVSNLKDDETQYGYVRINTGLSQSRINHQAATKSTPITEKTHNNDNDNETKNDGDVKNDTKEQSTTNVITHINNKKDPTKMFKFLFVSWAGKKVGCIQKAKAGVNKILIKQIIKDFSLEIYAEDSADLDEKAITHNLRVLGGLTSAERLDKFLVGREPSSPVQLTPRSSPSPSFLPSPRGVNRPLNHVPLPFSSRLTERQLFTLENGTVPDTEVLRRHFDGEGYLELEAAERLISVASEILSREPNLLRLSGLMTICGDIHGQFYDLLRLFELAGDLSKDPDAVQTNFLFLGDYVDRGSFSTETILYLYALKIRFPARLHLLRGNHECRLLGSFFNFKLECRRKYKESLYNSFMDSFDMLPVAALLENDLGRAFCVHGGISPSLKTLEDIERLDRRQEPPKRGLLTDLLWSDPLGEETTKFLRRPEEMEEWREIDFLPNPVRGCGNYYGRASAEQFLRDNDVQMIIRGHEVKEVGYEYYWYLKDREIGVEKCKQEPLILTVFSAPNYCDKYQNLASYLRWEQDKFYPVPFEAVDHPYYLPNFMNAFNYSLPFVVEKLLQIVDVIMKVTDDEENIQEVRNRVRKKLLSVSRMMKVMETLREERENIQQIKDSSKYGRLPPGLLMSGSEAIQEILHEAFEEARSDDLLNERRPDDVLDLPSPADAENE